MEAYNSNMSPDENALATLLLMISRLRSKPATPHNQAKLADLIQRRDAVCARCRASGLSYMR